uniref:Major facilitator superfamily (MFS) profile domain-containing protein n=1 Tax=Plectus sambesii TaxID=2011161 RepID=A0A914VRE5_9BILA
MRPLWSSKIPRSPLMDFDFDSALIEVGDFGRYQIWLFFLICLPASLPSAWSAFNQPFVVASPAHHCRLTADEENRTMSLPLRSCFQYNSSTEATMVPCQNGWVYDRSTYKETIVTEFDLVCDRKYWVELTTTAFYTGSFVGNFLFGHIADKFGRRVAFFIILSTLVVTGTLCSFAQNVGQFFVLRFFTGLPFPALFQVPFIISMEFMGKSGRIFSGIVISIFFGSAMAILGIVASFIREWRLLTLLCNAPYAILFSYYFFLPESARWLVSVRKFDDAKKIMTKMAKTNRKTVNVNELMAKLRSCPRASSQEEENNQHNVFDLFKTPNLRKKTLIITYVWLVNAIVYNGLTLNVSNLPVNDYLSFTINGAVELPAYFIVWPLLDRIGRRWPICMAMLIGGAACICTLFVPSNYGWMVAGLAFLGKFGIAGSFAVIYIFAGELYPTVVRAVGMGMSSMVAGSGLILGPYLIRLGEYVRILPLLIMGILTVSAGIASMFLPETLGIDLPQTIAEAEEFGKGFCPGHCFDRRRTSAGVHELNSVETNSLITMAKCDNNGDAVPV